MRDKVLYFYLGPRQRALVAAGEGKILTRVVETVRTAGWQVVLLPEEGRHAAPTMDGYHLVLNREVEGPFCLTLRKCYMDPFWRIEATNDRWDWQVGKLPFDPEQGRVAHLAWFHSHWQKKLFGDAALARDGFIFMPLQGKLTRHRRFQSMSPVEMITATLNAQPRARVLATLHPGEVYGPDEIAELAAISTAHPRFKLSDKPSMALLSRCDLVVTQNSSMALTGFFAGKPAVLFAQADFHHIAGSVPRQGIASAFQTATQTTPAYAEYLFWFFKRNAITSWDDDAPNRIRARLADHGWPI